MSVDKQEQLEKLARTLLKSGLSSNYDEALKRSREILKMPEHSERVVEKAPDPSSLPGVNDIKPAPVSVGFEFERDQTLKDVVDEDAKKIYDKPSPSEKQDE